MNRNTLTIGGICIVTILILVSFNCVVGHQSASNNIAKTSPLFNIRINRVLNNKQDSLDCVYNGMNENLVIMQYIGLEDRTRCLSKNRTVTHSIT